MLSDVELPSSACTWLDDDLDFDGNFTLNLQMRRMPSYQLRTVVTMQAVTDLENVTTNYFNSSVEEPEWSSFIANLDCYVGLTCRGCYKRINAALAGLESSDIDQQTARGFANSLRLLKNPLCNHLRCITYRYTDCSYFTRAMKACDDAVQDRGHAYFRAPCLWSSCLHSIELNSHLPHDNSKTEPLWLICLLPEEFPGGYIERKHRSIGSNDSQSSSKMNTIYDQEEMLLFNGATGTILTYGDTGVGNQYMTLELDPVTMKRNFEDPKQYTRYDGDGTEAWLEKASEAVDSEIDSIENPIEARHISEMMYLGMGSQIYVTAAKEGGQSIKTNRPRPADDSPRPNVAYYRKKEKQVQNRQIYLGGRQTGAMQAYNGEKYNLKP